MSNILKKHNVLVVICRCLPSSHNVPGSIISSLKLWTIGQIFFTEANLAFNPFEMGKITCDVLMPREALQQNSDRVRLWNFGVKPWNSERGFGIRIEWDFGISEWSLEIRFGVRFWNSKWGFGIRIEWDFGISEWSLTWNLIRSEVLEFGVRFWNSEWGFGTRSEVLEHEVSFGIRSEHVGH